MHYFSTLFGKVLYVSDRLTVLHQEYLNTVYTAIGTYASSVGVC
jgi:hypothetical protein